MLHRLPLFIAAAVAAGALQAFLARFFLLDDALIHVHAAQLLLQAGFPTSDGVTRSFGDSSPLFLLLTAAGYWMTSSLFVPKVLSLAGFATLVLLLAGAAWRERQGALQALFMAYLLLAVSPFGIRWLTDGMETSLAVVMVLLLANTGARAAPLRIAVLAALCVLLRVELVALVAVVSVGEVLRRRYLSALAALFGAVVALAAIHLVFGALWSDAAIAKARYGYSVVEFVTDLASAVGGAGLFGMGLVLAWLGLMAANLRQLWNSRSADRETLDALLGGMSLPAVLLAIFVKGQAMEGIRPLLPFIVFALARATSWFGRLHEERALRWGRVAVPVLAALAVVFAADGTAFERIVQSQARSLIAMRDKDWSPVRGHTGLAWDVGYLAYFARTPICDVQGLINGPQFARLTQDQRLERCARTAEFAFVDQPRFRMLAQERDLKGWRVCDRFGFARRTEAYSVYLLVSQGLATTPFCAPSSPRIGRSGDVDLSRIATVGE